MIKSLLPSKKKKDKESLHFSFLNSPSKVPACKQDFQPSTEANLQQFADEPCKKSCDPIHHIISTPSKKMAALVTVGCVVVGDKECGKTSFTLAFTGTLGTSSEPTGKKTVDGTLASAPFHRSQHIINDNFVAKVWDTSCSEAHSRLRALVYKATDVIVMVFSVRNRASFEALQFYIYPEIRVLAPLATIVVVATQAPSQYEKPAEDTHSKPLRSFESSTDVALKSEQQAISLEEVEAFLKRVKASLFLQFEGDELPPSNHKSPGFDHLAFSDLLKKVGTEKKKKMKQLKLKPALSP